MTITNFSAGELSENLKGRIDLQQYYSGAQKLSNFEIIPTGGIQRRAGFKRLGKLEANSRLIPFIVNEETSIIFEISSSYIHAWNNGNLMKDANGSVINLLEGVKEGDQEFKYSEGEIEQIQYAQNYDIMYFVHKEHRPLQIRFNIEFLSFTVGPMSLNHYNDVFIDNDYAAAFPIQKREEAYLPLQGKAGEYCIWRGGLYKCTQSNTETLSAVWERQGNDPKQDNGLFSDDVESEEKNKGKYPGSVAFFQNRLFFAGTKNHPQRIWASATPDTEDTRYNVFGNYQKYVTVNKVIKNPNLHIFSGDILKENVTSEYTVITNLTQPTSGLVDDSGELIDDFFISSGDVIPVGTKVLSAGERSLKVACSVIFEEEETAKVHQVFSVSRWRNPETATEDDYEFTVVQNNITTPDCSFFLEPASDQNDAIKWLATGNFLAVGTESNVWNIPQTVTATNVICGMNGRYGSDDIQAHVVDSAVVFFAQGKGGIREYYYNVDSEAFLSNNIALLSEHVLRESPARDFDFITNPYNKIVVTREDGIAVTLLYDKSSGVMAWNRIEHGKGKLRSCAVTRGNNAADFVYFTVEIDGEFYLEKLEEDEVVYLDSWELYNAENEVHIAMLENGAETYESDNRIYIGYPFTSLILSMPCIINSQSDKKRIVNLLVRFNKSYMPVMTVDELPAEHFTTVEEPFDGVCKIDYPGTSERDVTFTLQISKPEACKILTVDALLN